MESTETDGRDEHDSGKDATVLVVDDERALTDLYAVWLRERYDVRTAYGSREAENRLDGDVDVTVLDRRMPDRSGDELLAEIRDRGLDCRTVLVTAIRPEFDVVDLPCDGYLEKPVSRDTLLTVVELFLEARDCGPKASELLALVGKRATLQRSRIRPELERASEYRRLERRIRAVEADIGDSTGASALCRRMESVTLGRAGD